MTQSTNLSNLLIESNTHQCAYTYNLVPFLLRGCCFTDAELGPIVEVFLAAFIPRCIVLLPALQLI